MSVSEAESRYQFRVAWEHTDTAGYVHNSVYFRYFEIGECEWFRHLGIPWNAFPEHGFPRVHVEANFLRPLFFEDLCCLITRVLHVRTAKVYLCHELWRDDELAARGRVVFGSITTRDGKPCPLPDAMREVLSQRLCF